MTDITTDVTIIAAGVAGLSAAVSAAEAGAKTAIFEKAAITGGTGNMGTGLFAVESRLQRQMQVDLTKEKAFEIFMNYTHWRADPLLVKAYIDKTAETIDWLENMGVAFGCPSPFFIGGHATWHPIKGDAPNPGGPGSSAVMMRCLAQSAKDLGVEIFTETPAIQLIQEDGRITGIVAQSKEGKTLHARSKAVVIATGGCGDNPEMIRQFTGLEWGKDLFSMRIPGIHGEGMQMAWEAGAARTPINMEIIYDVRGLTDPVAAMAFRQPNLMVNLDGERFCDETLLGNPTFTGNALLAQKGRCAYSILDENTKELFMHGRLDFIHPMWPATKAEDLDCAIQKAVEQGSGDITAAYSIEALAEQTGIDKAGLIQTIETYNTACATGRDRLFHKDAKYLRPVRKPKYYAAKLVPSAYGSLGGIRINHRTEVLDTDQNPIPGLYAAGTDANTIYGDSYVFILPGNTQGFAVNTGRMAGENAAAYAKTRSGNA